MLMSERPKLSASSELETGALEIRSSTWLYAAFAVT